MSKALLRWNPLGMGWDGVENNRIGREGMEGKRSIDRTMWAEARGAHCIPLSLCPFLHSLVADKRPGVFSGYHVTLDDPFPPLFSSVLVSIDDGHDTSILRVEYLRR
jgi:hypothetical protein